LTKGITLSDCFSLILVKDLTLLTIIFYLIKLGNYVLPESLVRWFAALLMGRAQRVCRDSSLSSTKTLNGGIPQGTRFGSILFAVGVEDLLKSWDPRLNLLMI